FINDDQGNAWQDAVDRIQAKDTVHIWYALNAANAATTVTLHFTAGTATCIQNAVLSEGLPVAQIDPVGGSHTSGGNGNSFVTGVTSSTTGTNLWMIADAAFAVNSLA